MSEKKDTRPVLKTMKQKSWVKNSTWECILLSNQIASFEIFIRENKKNGYYKRVVIDRRGAVGEVNKPIKPFEVATTPDKMDDKLYDIRLGLIRLINEKTRNNIAAANKLLEELKKDGLYPKNKTIITNREVIEEIINPTPFEQYKNDKFPGFSHELQKYLRDLDEFEKDSQ